VAKGVPDQLEKKMGMIRDEYPCIIDRFRLGKKFRKAFKKILQILVIQEYLATLYPPDHNVMQDTGSLPAIGFAFRRGGRVARLKRGGRASSRANPGMAPICHIALLMSIYFFISVPLSLMSLREWEGFI